MRHGFTVLGVLVEYGISQAARIRMTSSQKVILGLNEMEKKQRRGPALIYSYHPWFCRSVAVQLNGAGNRHREGVAIHGPEPRAAPAPTFTPFITSPALILLHPAQQSM